MSPYLCSQRSGPQCCGMKNILYLCAAKNETAMTKQFSFAVLCLLFLAACNKTPQPQPQPELPPLDYDYAGRVYADQPSFGLVSVFDFVSSDSVYLSTHIDSWDGELALEQINHRGYGFEYRSGTPLLVTKWVKMFAGDTLKVNEVSYEIIDDSHFVFYPSLDYDNVYSRVR